jgi:hypothetical protein
MISRLARYAFAALALVAFAGSAQALQFANLTVDDCDAFGCEGSTLYLSVQEEVGGSWLVTYTINTDNYTGDRLGFNQVGFKAIGGWTTGTVLSSPWGRSPAGIRYTPHRSTRTRSATTRRATPTWCA